MCSRHRTRRRSDIRWTWYHQDRHGQIHRTRKSHSHSRSLLKQPRVLVQYYRTVTFDALLGGGEWRHSPSVSVTNKSTESHSRRRVGRFGCKTSNAIDAKECAVVKGMVDGWICEHYLIGHTLYISVICVFLFRMLAGPDLVRGHGYNFKFDSEDESEDRALGRAGSRGSD